MRAPVLFLIVAACGGARPRATSNTCEAAATPAWVAALAHAPSRLACAVDPAVGVSVTRIQSCEVEPAVEEHLQLHDAALAAQVPVLDGDVTGELEYLDDARAITCTAARCVIPASGECRLQITLVFGETAARRHVVTAIVERDDWE